jgi:hypothetical protein
MMAFIYLISGLGQIKNADRIQINLSIRFRTGGLHTPNTQDAKQRI